MTIATETATFTSAKSATWVRVCQVSDILPWCGVAALFGTRQIALLRWGDGDQIHAVDNFDPCSKAMVISRGILGDYQGEPMVASPVYKQRFRLRDGTCIDDATVSLATYPVRVIAGAVEIHLPA